MPRWPRRKSSPGAGEGVGPGASADPGAGGNGRAPQADSGAEGTWQEVIGSGNATGSSGAFVNTGIYNSTVTLPPEALRPPAEVDAPPGMDDLPYRPGLFVGRGPELDRLDAALAAPGMALVQAVAGLGGIGKSALAAHWAANRPHGHAPIRWITADSPASLLKGLADLATAVQPALARALPAEALAEWGTQWLAGHTGWLIILDNVNDPADIAPLIARARGGRFLITSRLATAWSDAATLVRLDILEPAESLSLLTRATATTTGPARDLDGAAELCEELGHLPLGIQQAAAYLAQNPLTTPRSYLRLLAEHPATMYRHGAATTPAERTVARIWNVTLDRVTALQPEAAGLLRTLAWYAPDHIPTTLLEEAATDPPALNLALGLLTAYSMITPDPATTTLSVHRLVQALARTPDPDDPHRTPALIDRAREQATTALYTVLPTSWDTPATWPAWRTLLPHIDALTDHTTEDTDTDTTAYILNETGLFLENQGMVARAIRNLERSLAGRLRLLGEDHASTVTSRNNLAYAYESAGDLERAVPLYEQTLADCVRVLGKDHPHTLASRNNLACAYQSAGDLERAIPLYERSLADRARVLGEDDPSTLASRNNLAYAYRHSGDLERAVTLYEQAIADCARILGEDHPNTLTFRNNLACAHKSAGRLEQAISLHERTLADRARVLGEDHPSTLDSRNNLADTYQSAGDLERSIALYEQTLTDCVRVLGEDHIDTLNSRNNLAYAYKSAGHLERAITLYEQTLTDCARILGEKHSVTARVRDNLTAALAEHDGEPGPPS